MTRSTTLARIAVETAPACRWIDDALFGPLELATVAGYRRFLARLYGFQAPLEVALAATPGIDHDLVVPRCRAGRIAGDLLALGLTRHEHALLARRQAIAPFAEPGEAYAWMYATERLMLRVEPLRLRLANELPIVSETANQFLSAYAHVAELRWCQFGIALDRAAHASDREQIVANARAAIAALREWLAREPRCASPGELGAAGARA